MTTPSIESFSFDLTVEQRNLRDVVKVVLHAICFHRVFGTIRPRTIQIFGMTFPAIDEAEIEAMVEEKTANLCRQIESKACKRAELLLYLLHPSTSSAPPKSGSPRPDSGAFASSSSTSPSVGGASSSLKSWASSKTVGSYPYAWIAHAFSGGVGQAGGSLPPSSDEQGEVMARELEKERARIERQAFEVWTVRFQVVQARSERERLRLHSATATEMARFLDAVLRFVDEKKTHIPAIISADLCPFPIEIQGVALP